jgi:hypothetical protein
MCKKESQRLAAGRSLQSTGKKKNRIFQPGVFGLICIGM